MKNELAQVINLVEQEGNYFVSSKEVSERFGKRHDNVLRDIEKLQVSDNFRLLNFEEISDADQYGRGQKVFLMTRDGFSMLAFGFTGEEAMKWKEMFLEAFKKMEKFISDKFPALEERIKQLVIENKTLRLDVPKKQHHLTNTVLIPVTVNTIFGPEIEYHRVQKDQECFSNLTYKEGKLRQLSSLATGMLKKITALTEDIALLRRM